MRNYTAPVNALLTYGDGRKRARQLGPGWPDYVSEFGFNETHIDELIEMATDADLNWADSESLEVWAPLHAWRTLGQLRAHPAIIPLLRLLDQLERDDDWAHNELPAVFAMMGAPAIEPVSEYLFDRTKDELARAAVAQALTLIAERYPEQGERCSDAMIHCLRGFETNPDTLNGLLIAELLHLHETGIMDLRAHAAVIEQAFQANAVDCSVAGDWEDVQIELGLLDRRLTPPRNYLAEKIFGDSAAQGHALPDTFEPAYSDTPQPKTVVRPVKIGRNNPCPCGSGRKYKKCCLRKERHG